MRFLCLHGRGLDAEIFEHQTEQLREALDPEHEFVFIDGGFSGAPKTGFAVANAYGGKHLGFWPPDGSSDSDYRQAYYDLQYFIESYGPFEGLMGFSEGASIAANILIEDGKQPSLSRLGFKCAIFFSAIPPLHLNLTEEKGVAIRVLDPAKDGVLLHLPTAHIWSRTNDAPGVGEILLRLCNDADAERALHDLGHEVPGSRSDEGLFEAVRCVRRTIEKASDSY